MMRTNLLFALTSLGFAGLLGCSGAVTITPPVLPVAPVAPPPVAAVVAPPPPALHTVCDADIKSDGRFQFPHEVEFNPGSASINMTDTTKAILGCLVQFFNENPMVTKFRFEGHTDGDGNHDANVQLSDARAKAVSDWIQKNGVDPTRLMSKGFGPDHPVAANDTPEHKALNRRVEFHLDRLDCATIQSLCGADAKSVDVLPSGVKTVHISPERIAAAMHPVAPAAVVVAAPAAPAFGVSVATPAIPAVAVPAAPTIGVSVATPAVAAPTVGVSAPTPSVSVGVGTQTPPKKK
jgi:outer membrane protein OmpA-like peptidoglycan-associated protein